MNNSTKRKDKKGRILKNGETQRKDGRYCYTYSDSAGTRRSIYSWKLEPTDKPPAGKQEETCLRDKEKLLERIGYSFQTLDQVTVYELAERYTKTKTGVKYTTTVGYQTVLKILSKEDFGRRKIIDVRTSDAKLWLIKLQQEDGRGYSSIHSIRGVLRPAFQMAVDDDLLIKNPFEFQLATVIVNDSVTREAISRKQERQFLAFVKNDQHFKRYYEGVYILFKTGLRIGEFCGLTINDIDFKEKTINVCKQLQRKADGTKYIISTKTNSGKRVIPVTDDILQCFREIIKKRRTPEQEPMTDGITGFLYLDKNGQALVPLHWQKYFQHMTQKYNKTFKVELPPITPHVCRHTYCSNMAKSGMNPKSLQYLMGHSDISVTLNTYTHFGLEDAKAEVNNLTHIKEFPKALQNKAQ